MTAAPAVALADIRPAASAAGLANVSQALMSRDARLERAFRQLDEEVFNLEFDALSELIAKATMKHRRSTSGSR
jgi:hypothetical protein